MDAERILRAAEGSRISEGSLEGQMPSLVSRVPVEAFIERADRRAFLKNLLEITDNQFESSVGALRIINSLSQADLISVTKLFAREGIYLDQDPSQALLVTGAAQLERLRYLNLLTARDLSKVVQALKNVSLPQMHDERDYDQILSMHKSGEYQSEQQLCNAYHKEFPGSALTTQDIKSWINGLHLPPEVAKRDRIFDLPSAADSGEITEAFERHVRRHSSRLNPLTQACRLAVEMIGSLEYASLRSEIPLQRLQELVRGGIAPERTEFASLLSAAGISTTLTVMQLWNSSHLNIAPRNEKQILALLSDSDQSYAKNYMGSLKVAAVNAAERGEDVSQALRAKMKEIRARIARMTK